MKIKQTIKKIILCFIGIILLLEIVSAYPLLSLCYDENEKGIECFGLLFIGEIGLRNRTITNATLFYGAYDLCYIEEKGVYC